MKWYQLNKLMCELMSKGVLENRLWKYTNNELMYFILFFSANLVKHSQCCFAVLLFWHRKVWPWSNEHEIFWYAANAMVCASKLHTMMMCWAANCKIRFLHFFYDYCTILLCIFVWIAIRDRFWKNILLTSFLTSW